ncbi:hypothetical protein ACWEKT_32685 [Nocardia takedensis]
MKVLATAAVVVAAGLTLTACGDDNTTTPISATSTAQLTAQQSGMAARTRETITSEASRTGGTVQAYGPPEFPTDLQVVMWADITSSGAAPRRTWFKVSFLGSADSIVPYGTPKRAPSPNGPWI